MTMVFIVLVPVALITLPFWVHWVMPWVVMCLPTRYYKAARFLAHSLVEDRDWQLAPGIAMHPHLGFLRMQSGLVEVLWWKGHMDWVEEQVIDRALRRAIKQQALPRKAEVRSRGLRQLEREIARHDA